MKLKTSALALAIAGIVAAPIAAQADIGAYASIRLGLINQDDGDGADAQTNVINRSSRFGVRSETDLGNGMSAFGRYEFAVRTESAEADGTTGSGGHKDGDAINIRHAYVGLKGGFGSVTIGQTYHNYYNHINGPVDIANNNSGFYGLGRTGDAVAYANEMGNISFGVTAYLDGDATTANAGTDDLDAMEVAGSFDAGVVKVAVGMVDRNDDASPGTDPETQTGVTVSGTFGDVYAAISLQSNVDGVEDKDSTELSASMGPFYFAYGQAEVGSNDPTDLTLGYNMAVGRNTDAWFEYTSADADDGSDDDTSLEAILKYSWN